MIYLLLIIILVLILSFLLIDISLGDNFIIIKLFKIKIFEKKNKSFFNMLSKLNFNSNEMSTKTEMEIFNHIKFLSVSINLKTRVNNRFEFMSRNIILNSALNFYYPLIKDRFPNLKVLYLENDQNSFKIEGKILVNGFNILFDLVKGKIREYGSKRNKSNVK